MASLKEIKVRIASIHSTQKITSAMKMVSSAKLHHAQTESEHSLAYATSLTTILNGLLSAECDMDSPYTQQRKVKQVAVVAFSSNTGLCGAFNSNIWKELTALISKYKQEGVSLLLYPVGKKIADELRKAGYQTENDFVQIGAKPSYEGAARLASVLMQLFTSGKADRVELLYHHFKGMAEQILTTRTYLPVTLPQNLPAGTTNADYLFEPSQEMIQAALFPKILNLDIYTTLLDTTTSEHAARMLAMQIANDNANDLIRQLTQQYNKTRQQAITNELLDIMGGAG